MLADAPNGVQKLRELILQLAVRGKLVPQDPSDDPAGALLERIAAEKGRLFGDGKIGKPTLLAPIGEDDARSQLPDGWSWARLAELGEFCGGSTPSKGNASYWGEGVPWVSPKDMKSDFITDSEDAITERALNETRIRLVPPRSLLIVTRSGILRRTLPVGINTMRCTVNQDLKVLIPYVTGIEEYLRILLRGHEAFILRELVKGGMTVQSVVFDQFERYAFPFPPLREQRRIVAKVDELMALCDTLETQQQRRTVARMRLSRSALHQLTTASDDAEFAAHWQRLRENFHLLYDTPETVAELRQEVLELAMRGKLVPQDASDEPAAVLLNRITVEKQRLFHEGKIGKPKEMLRLMNDWAPFELPAGWEWVRVSEITSKIGSGSTPLGGKNAYVAEGVKFLRSQNVWNNGLHLGSVAFIPPHIHVRMAGTAVQAGDLLLNITGASIGRSALVPDDFDVANVSQHVSIVRPVNPETRHFLHLALIAPYFQDAIMQTQVGISREGLSVGRLAEMPIPLPPLSEQRRIVAKMDELMALCDALEVQLTRACEKSAYLAASAVHHLTAA